MNVICEICKVVFRAKCNNAKYCSNECRHIAKKYTTAAWVRKNKEKIRVYSANYYLLNKDAKIKKDKKYRRMKMKNDIQYRLRANLRKRLSKALKNNQKVGSAIRDLGCSIPELKKYLESKFTKGMSWDNYGLHGWHIDHIRPLTSFNLADLTQLQKACHYTNLQPLWAKDNLSKSSTNRLDIE